MATVNLNEVNLNRLIAFKAVVDAGSLTAAAERLGLAKTMVSKHMQLLEAEIGVSLLVRSTRRLSLTEAGRAFYEASCNILNSAEEAIVLARTGLETPHGTLRVAAPIDYGVMVIAPLLVDLRARFPALKVELVCGDHVVDLIAEGLDVAVRLGKLVDSSLVAVQVGGYAKWLVASPAFIAAHGAPDTLEALTRLPFITLTVLPQPLTMTLEGPNNKKRVVRMTNPAFSSNTVYACRAAVLAGDGVALQTDFSVNEDIQAGRLVRVLPEWGMSMSGIHAVFPASSRLQRKVRVFIDALKTVAGNPDRST